MPGTNKQIISGLKMNIPNDLKNAIETNSLVIWVGAGYQKTLGFPNWSSFILELAKLSYNDKNEYEQFLERFNENKFKDNLDVLKKTPLQILNELEFSKDKIFKKLPEIFKLPTKNNMDAIWLPFNRLWRISHKIITTNYDTSLENVSNKPPFVQTVLYYKRHQLGQLIKDNGFLFKLHGCVHDEPRKCIVFQDQYENLYKDFAIGTSEQTEEHEAKFLLKHLLTKYSILFLGYGIKDDTEIDNIFSRLDILLSEIKDRKHFRISTESDSIHREYLHNIIIDSYNTLPEYLSNLSSYFTANKIPVSDVFEPFAHKYIERDTEKEKILNFLGKNNNHFLYIWGRGGIGKSHFLKEILTELNTEFIYLKLTTAFTIYTLADRLGLGYIEQVEDLSKPNMDFVNKAITINKIVILDDLYEIEYDLQLKESILALQNIDIGKFIIISRKLDERFTKTGSTVENLHFDLLKEPEHREFLLSYSTIKHNRTIDKEFADKIFSISNGYPLVSTLICDNLFNPLASLDLDNLKSWNVEEDEDGVEFVHRILDVVLKSQSSEQIEFVYDFAQAIEEIPVDLAKQLTESKDVLNELVLRKDFIQLNSNKNLTMHALIREILQQKAGNRFFANAIFAKYYYSRFIESNTNDTHSFYLVQEYNRKADVKTKEEIEEYFRTKFVDARLKELLTSDIDNYIAKLEYRLLNSSFKSDIYHQLGISYRKKGNVEKALAYLEKCDPNPYQYNELGITLRHEKRIPEAIKWFTKGADAGSQSCMNELGITLRQEKRIPEAIEWFTKGANASELACMNELGITLRQEKRIPEAIEWFTKGANAGEPSCMNELGITLRQEKRIPEAIEWFTKGADAGNQMCMNELGITLRQEKRIPEAIEWLTKGANAGNQICTNELGITLRQEKRIPEAIKWFTKGANAGELACMNELGITLRQEKRILEAIEWFTKGANAGELSCMNELGITLRQEKRILEAIKWFTKGANAGNQICMNELGITLRQEKRILEAIKWLTKGANAGNQICTNELGITLRQEKRIPEAIEWFTKGADAGSQSCMNELGITLRQEKRIPEAIKWFTKGAEAGNQSCMNELGITLRQEKRIPEAIKWFTKGADDGNQMCMNELGITLRQEKRIIEAIKWFTKGANAGNQSCMNELGITLRQEKRIPEAIKWFTKGANAGNQMCMNELGITLRQEKRIIEAIKWFTKGANAGNQICMNELGITFRQEKRIPEAIEWLTKGASLKNSHCTFQLAIIYKLEEDYNSAIKYFKKSLQLWKNVRVYEELFYSYMKTLNYEEAYKTIKKMLESDIVSKTVYLKGIDLCIYYMYKINDFKMAETILTKIYAHKLTDKSHFENILSKINKFQSIYDPNNQR
jgi:TPR repeat protein